MKSKPQTKNRYIKIQDHKQQNRNNNTTLKNQIVFVN